MSEDEPPKSTGILMEGDCRNNTFENVTVSGFDEALAMKEKDGKAPSGNRFINFKAFTANRLKPLAAAIKKPTANGNKGWKIIVGTILTGFIVGVLVHEYSLWRGKAMTETNPSSTQQPIKSSREIQK